MRLHYAQIYRELGDVPRLYDGVWPHASVSGIEGVHLESGKHLVRQRSTRVKPERRRVIIRDRSTTVIRNGSDVHCKNGIGIEFGSNDANTDIDKVPWENDSLDVGRE